MRIHRFYISEKIDEEILSIGDDKLIHQWRNVFRYNIGSRVILFDGSGFDYEAIIEYLPNNKEAKVRIISRQKGIIPRQKINLYQSLIKKDNMEWVIQKATELGVSKIIPIISDRSEKKGFNLERAKKIVIEASEQCGRSDIPEIGEMIKLESLILNPEENLIVFDVSGTSIINSSHDIQEASVFIGPEGGWSESEINLFKEKGFKIYKLGDLTLRAETAVVVALTALTLK